MRTTKTSATKCEPGYVLFLAASGRSTAPIFVAWAAIGHTDEVITNSGFEIGNGPSRLLGWARATEREAADFTKNIADRQIEGATNWYYREGMEPLLAQLAPDAEDVEREAPRKRYHGKSTTKTHSRSRQERGRQAA